MKIAVAGGTGVVGRRIVEAVDARGDEAVVLARSTGVDLVTGAGIDRALDGVEAVVDASNINTLSAPEATAFFEKATSNLIAGARRAAAGHVVLLSIVGIDRNPHDYYAAKLAQEAVVEASEVPWTILRATQFHEFAGQMFDRAKLGPLHVAPRARVQPIAAQEVGQHLASIAAGRAQRHAPDLAGPREERLDEMVKAYARRIGFRGWVPSLSVPGAQMKGMRAGLALPEAGALLGTQTFAEWLQHAS